MILSHDKRFIFIHIYKVAGKSIRNVLQPYDNLSPKDFPWYQNLKFNLGVRYRHLSDWSINHIKAKTIKFFLPPEIYNSYFKFCFVRNPWDWQVSLFHYMLQNEFHPQHEIIKKMKDFDEYIEWRIHHDCELQKDFVYDKNDELLVDYVGRFEYINQDFEEICLRLEIPPVQLPQINKSNHNNYKEYYNKHTRDLVYNAFKEDIDHFHYDFGQ